jgi:hypothetical protein
MATLLLVCDYFALFGSKQVSGTDFIEMNFKTVDEETARPVTRVHARCFQKYNNNACAEKKDPASGTVSILVPVTEITTKSFLFVQEQRLQETQDPRLHVMFIHEDYANPVETFTISELPLKSAQLITVKMPRPLAAKYQEHE